MYRRKLGEQLDRCKQCFCAACVVEGSPLKSFKTHSGILLLLGTQYPVFCSQMLVGIGVGRKSIACADFQYDIFGTTFALVTAKQDHFLTPTGAGHKGKSC